MRTVLTDIRSAFEHHIEAFGPDIPGDEPEARIVQKPIVQKTTSLPVSIDIKETRTIDSPYDRIAALIPADSPLHKLTTLAEVSDYVQNTNLIELDETRINSVFGVGDPDADLMVVGEAPGADEDKQGEPFVGRAGKLLTQILQAIGFEREHVYIANILKSRPPDNRPPKPDEVAAHVPILYKQISLIKPKVMLCVGKTSGSSLLGLTTSLGSMRGIFHDFHGLPVMVTYHPAALLRNPNWKRPTWDDMQQLRDYYKEIGGRVVSANPSTSELKTTHG
ncbi:MAG: uracil-DNA glycosylase [Bacteroidetes bacterium]|nr:MAG: uracil-DNA glycosylase [Bacteroidota bacterium]